MKPLDKILNNKNALVITPFLPYPKDAGHRKRVSFFIESLKELGCSVTLLHFAAEFPYVWGENRCNEGAARLQVDELLTYLPRKYIWQKPKNNNFHDLDEWIDNDFYDYVHRLSRFRHYDFCVINNVWMSKVLEALPPWIVRINETHDVFSLRANSFKKINKIPDFFTCTYEAESLGWRRADINIAITNKERLSIQHGSPNSKNIHLPQFEGIAKPNKTDYISNSKVVFGFIGSAHPFNVNSLIELLSRLTKKMRWAPIEFVVAGDVASHLSIQHQKIVNNIGYVKDTEEFYNKIDIVVSPLDEGSGLKIKVVEAISFGVPILATKHSAEGTDLVPQLVLSDVEDLSNRIFHIACNRPKFDILTSYIRLTQRSLQLRYNRQLRLLATEIVSKQLIILIKFDALYYKRDDVRFWIVLGMIRELSSVANIVLFWEERAPPSWIVLLPPNVRLSGTGDFGGIEPRSRFDLNDTLIHGSKLSVITDDSDFKFGNNSFYVLDTRTRDSKYVQECDILITHNAPNFPSITEKYYPLPLFSETLRWDPILNKGRVSDKHGSLNVVISDFLFDDANESNKINQEFNSLFRSSFCVSDWDSLNNLFRLIYERPPKYINIHQCVEFSKFSTVLVGWCQLFSIDLTVSYLKINVNTHPVVSSVSLANDKYFTWVRFVSLFKSTTRQFG